MQAGCSAHEVKIGVRSRRCPDSLAGPATALRELDVPHQGHEIAIPCNLHQKRVQYLQCLSERWTPVVRRWLPRTPSVSRARAKTRGHGRCTGLNQRCCSLRAILSSHAALKARVANLALSLFATSDLASRVGAVTGSYVTVVEIAVFGRSEIQMPEMRRRKERTTMAHKRMEAGSPALHARPSSSHPWISVVV
jgi:hypothetical protein